MHWTIVSAHNSFKERHQFTHCKDLRPAAEKVRDGDSALSAHVSNRWLLSFGSGLARREIYRWFRSFHSMVEILTLSELAKGPVVGRMPRMVDHILTAVQERVQLG
jgi:hypothetical protein